MKTVCLISCGSKKREGKHPAKDLYIGNYFAASRKYAEKKCHAYYIISGLHGLLGKDQEVEKYEYSLVGSKKNKFEFKKTKVPGIVEFFLNTYKPDTIKIISLLSESYSGLITPLKEAGYSVDEPCAGLPIGKRNKWLHEQLVGTRQGYLL